MNQIQTHVQTQNQAQTKKWKPNIYFSPNIANSEFSELSVYNLVDHVKEALEEAEQLIRRGKPSLNDVKKIVEKKVTEKLNQYQDIEYVEYYFDESAPWEEVGSVAHRVYDAIDDLKIVFVDGPEVLFNIYADYVVVDDDGEELVAYYRINSVELVSVRW